MVQMGAHVDYQEHEDGAQEPATGWAAVVRDSIQEFVSSLGESSKQLGGAAHFVGDAARLIEEAAARAQRAEASTRDLAVAAEQAVTEATRKAAELYEASERLRDETQALLNDATQRQDEALSASQVAAAHASAKVSGVAAGPSAQQVLDRLEVDYRLLSELVQALHSRITGLAAATTAPSLAPISGAATHVEAPTELATTRDVSLPDVVQEADYAPEPWRSTHETVAVEAPVEQYVPLEALGDPIADAIEPDGDGEHSYEPEPSPPEAPGDTATEAPSSLEGKISLYIAPVPDFDRLLSLDSALGRLPGVAGVTLADYTREEVVFQVELAAPDALSGSLADAAGCTINVLSANAAELRLRLAGAGS